MGLVAPAVAGCDQRHPHCCQRSLEGQHRDDGVVGGLLPRAGLAGDREHREARGGEHEAQPLAALELEAEEALGHHGEHHEPACEDRLNERQGSERERPHVEQVGHDGQRVADRPPLRAEQADRAAQRMPQLHRGCRDGSTVAQEEADLGYEGGQPGQHEPNEKRHASMLPGPSRG
jgi:hypothetical protein